LLEIDQEIFIFCIQKSYIHHICILTIYSKKPKILIRKYQSQQFSSFYIIIKYQVILIHLIQKIKLLINMSYERLRNNWHCKDKFN